MPDSPAVPPTWWTAQVLLSVLAQVKGGDFAARMPLEWTGVAGKVADGLNEVIIANQALEKRAGPGQPGGRQAGRAVAARRARRAGPRAGPGSVESVNSLIDDLVRPTIEMQRVIGAVADGDLSKKVSADVRGEMLELKNTINAMVDQLNGFISEVTRVAREVGTEGKLGQAAAVTIEVGGVWKDLTDNVNLMAGNLTGQVRNIAEVTTAVANGDLSKKISIDVKGEFLELKNTVNAMVDQLKAFAGEVTRVAREVGVEGKLGGQAQSKEVGGVWKDLTDNVNQLAANLTNQVRAIAEVATAVTEGDLTRQVRVEASGEVAVLKDKLNEMIRNLRETTRQNVEQDWLKTNRERFTRMLQGQDDLTDVSSMILSELAPLVSAQHGVFYSMTSTSDQAAKPCSSCRPATATRSASTSRRRSGSARASSASAPRRRSASCSPTCPATTCGSTPGSARPSPLNIIVLPVLFEGSLRAVVELASFSPFSVTHQAFLDSITESIGIVLSTIEAAGLTETPAQAVAVAGRGAALAAGGAARVQRGPRRARPGCSPSRTSRRSRRTSRSSSRSGSIEEKVGQLAVSSKYKSEFIANMSHELRTPLNSLLILAQQLEDNPDNNMTATQVEYASVIRSSGKELLELLNSILDLAKVESGTVTVENERRLDRRAARRPAARVRAASPGKGPRLTRSTSPPAAPATIVTDPQRLRQILKNLLANAFKFTERGSVRVADRRRARRAGARRRARSSTAPPSSRSRSATRASASTTEQQQRIFEAFAQGDGTTARLYGGTGLGLSISRELVGLLGGEITRSRARRARAARSPSTCPPTATASAGTRGPPLAVAAVA